jgi:hypothetical protein
MKSLTARVAASVTAVSAVAFVVGWLQGAGV